MLKIKKQGDRMCYFTINFVISFSYQFLNMRRNKLHYKLLNVVTFYSNILFVTSYYMTNLIPDSKNSWRPKINKPFMGLSTFRIYFPEISSSDKSFPVFKQPSLIIFAVTYFRLSVFCSQAIFNESRSWFIKIIGTKTYR